MRDDQLDALYATLSHAIGRVGEQAAALFLATLVLDLVSKQADPAGLAEAIERAERLTRGSDAS